MSRLLSAHPTHALGTLLSVWAHPDDETYLAGGVMAAARAHGQRVVCVSATAGEHGTDDPVTWPPDRLAAARRAEAAAAMVILGVHEHHVLGFADGAVDPDDEAGIAAIGRLIAEIRPDTILTFGPTGTTFHPDHVAVHRWVTAAWDRAGRSARLLYSTSTAPRLRRFRKAFEEWGVYMTDQRPVGVAFDALAVHLELDGAALARKVAALRAMRTQTADLLAVLDGETFEAIVAEEAFVDASDST